ncbi:rod shape-determining protein MreC [Patescibacteria group bacterium]|nr:rod shape-determining protein MreC [Patescibacteria group bacterium]
MKKTSLAKRNALLTSTNISWGALALGAVIVLLLVRLIAPNMFWQAFAPVFRSANVVAEKSHAFLSSFGDTASLTLQNERLVSENNALANENQALLHKEASIGALAAPGGIAEGIIAGVVARPPASPYDTLVLSSGTNAGVAVGQEAFGEGGVPLGVVSSVLDDFSRVTLFSSPTVVMQGWVGRLHVPLAVFGSGAGTMRASLARSAGISVGDTVFTSGPGMLPVGSVVRIESDPSSPAVVLHIQPAVNLFSVAWVTLRATGMAFTHTLSWATSTLP